MMRDLNAGMIMIQHQETSPRGQFVLNSCAINNTQPVCQLGLHLKCRRSCIKNDGGGSCCKGLILLRSDIDSTFSNKVHNLEL